MAKSKTNDDSELIESLDILTDFEVLDTEADWRMLGDTQNLNKNIEKTAHKNAAGNSPFGNSETPADGTGEHNE